MKRVVSFEVLDNYRIRLRFDDGVEGTVDLGHLVGQGVFSAWRDYGFFRQAFLSKQGALTWPGELDLCPDALYLEVTGLQPDRAPVICRLTARSLLVFRFGFGSHRRSRALSFSIKTKYIE